MFFMGAVIGTLFGLYVGEVKRGRFLHQFLVNGRGGQVPPAEVWEPDGQVDMEPLKLVRQADGEVKSMTWSDETVNLGVNELLMEARARGQALSPEDARTEVMLMLNSQDGEMG